MLSSAEQLSREGAFVRAAADKVTVRGLIEAAERKRKDAEIEQNSWDTRVEANYDACFNVALAVVHASGWKPKSEAGHHQNTLEAACAAFGAGEGLFNRADAIRILRNQKYAGIGRTQQDYDASRNAMNEFLGLAVEWLRTHHGSLLKG